MFSACTLVCNQEQICLQLCLQILRGGPLLLHHPLHSHQTSHPWYFSHSCGFSYHCFYTVTFLVGYHCTPWSPSTPVHSCAGWLEGADVAIGPVLYIYFAPFLWITLLLLSCGNSMVSCALCTSLLLVFRGDGAGLPLCFLHKSASCIPRRCHRSSAVNPAQLDHFYSAAMARIFFCASCITLILLFRGGGAAFPVLRTHLLLCFVNIYVVLVHNSNCSQH